MGSFRVDQSRRRHSIPDAIALFTQNFPHVLRRIYSILEFVSEVSYCFKSLIIRFSLTPTRAHHHAFHNARR